MLRFSPAQRGVAFGLRQQAGNPTVPVGAKLTPSRPVVSISNFAGLPEQHVAQRWHSKCSAAVAAAPVVEEEEVERPGIEVIRSSKHDAGLRVEVIKNGDKGWEVNLQAEPPRPMMLHWSLDGWAGVPPKELWPLGTHQEGDKAAQTKFPEDGKLKICFPEALCPQSIVFVLKETTPEKWINDGGVDFTINLKPPGISNLAEKVMAAEGSYSNWSLFNRFCMVIESLDAADASGPDGMALIYTWLRLSTLRQLDWYRNSNYQSKDIAHVQQNLAERMAAKARGSKDPLCREFARMALEGLPRGGGNGDDIRMGILNIMRGNGIKEGHRPGIDEKFLEQWHQKLHTNTTPDDIAICEAYLAFLHSNNHDDYWRVMWDVGKIGKKDLEAFSKPITAWPMHLPHLIDPFKHYLWLLKVTHSGADLDTANTMAKSSLDGDLAWIIQDILNNRNEWWVPGKIVVARERLADYWKKPDSSRDIVLLDIALESWFRMCLERTDKSQMKGDDIIEVVSLVLKNTLISVDSEELTQVVAQWDWVKAGGGGERWSQGWAMCALAAVQRMELSLAAHMDSIYSRVQPIAEQFQEACKLDAKYIMNFGEEVVRGRPLFVLSPLLQALEPMLRSSAGVSSWQVVSTGSGSASGLMQSIASLADVQGRSFPTPTVLLAEEVGGNEDIPAGVVAVLTRSATDVLSHAAIRSRSQRVLLATCYDAKQWTALKELAASPAAPGAAGPAVTVGVSPEGDVRASMAAEQVAAALNQQASTSGRGASGPRPERRLAKPGQADKWVLKEFEFADDLVGAKALNCAALARAAAIHSASHKVPASLSLPYGTFEQVMQHKANNGVNFEFLRLLRSLDAATESSVDAEHAQDALRVLGRIRELLSGSNLVAPPELRASLAAAASTAGMIPSANTWAAEGGVAAKSWAAAWNAICKVWASKWNDRAWLSRRTVGVPEDDLVMAVLIQQVVPAEYAFVLHTANPVTGTPGELFGEVVAGMGEALVGNYAGRALSFSSGPEGTKVLSLPSKRVSLHAAFAKGVAPLIARSDANGEDLEDLAGAGLYDSVPFSPLEERPVNYATEKLMTDPAFREQLAQQLVSVGKAVKDQMGGAEQDIEGVLSNGEVWVVQSRPQVMHK